MEKAERICKPSERLYDALAIRKMRQVDLANKSGLNKALISQYLKGKYEPMSDKVYLMAQALDVDPVWLMGFDVPMVKELPKSTANLKIENAKVLADVAKSDRLMAYVKKLAEMSTEQQEFIFSNIDFILKDKE